MRRSFALGTAALFLLLVVALAIRPRASLGQTQPSGSFGYVGLSDQFAPGSPGAQLGTWDVLVTPAPGPGAPPPFSALVTYTADGSVIESDANFPGVGQGAWVPRGGRTVGLTLVKELFDKNGQFLGVQKIREVHTLGSTAPRYSGTGKVELILRSGAVAVSTTATVQAARVVVEAP